MNGSPPPARAGILIVDDNADARRLLALLLGSEGYRLLIARDDREALRIVERVRELAAVGAMAVTLGHEINNPLTTVLGNVQLVLRRDGLDGTPRARLEAALEASRRIRGLVQRLVKIDKFVTKRYLGSIEMVDLERSSNTEGPDRAAAGLADRSGAPDAAPQGPA